MRRPCNCKCEYYQHEPHIVSGRNWDMEKNKWYGACLICDDCMRFEEMDNLSYLEYLAHERT